MKNKAFTKLSLIIAVVIILAATGYFAFGTKNKVANSRVKLSAPSKQIDQKSRETSMKLQEKIVNQPISAEEDSESKQQLVKNTKSFDEQSYAVNDLLIEFDNEKATPERKQEILKELVNMPFTAVLPNILPAILEYSQQSIDHPNCESQIASDLCMSLAVWSLHMKNPDFKTEKGEYFTELLKQQKTDETATPFMTKLILDSIALNWIPSAGEPVADILARDDLDLSTKLRSTTLLIGKSDLDYAGLITDAAENSTSSERSKYLSKILWHAKFQPMQPQFVALTFNTITDHDVEANGPINSYGLIKQTAEYLSDTSKTHSIPAEAIKELEIITQELEKSDSIDQAAATAAAKDWWNTYGQLF